MTGAFFGGWSGWFGRFGLCFQGWRLKKTQTFWSCLLQIFFWNRLGVNILVSYIFYYNFSNSQFQNHLCHWPQHTIIQSYVNFWSVVFQFFLVGDRHIPLYKLQTASASVSIADDNNNQNKKCVPQLLCQFSDIAAETAVLESLNCHGSATVVLTKLCRIVRSSKEQKTMPSNISWSKYYGISEMPKCNMQTEQ